MKSQWVGLFLAFILVTPQFQGILIVEGSKNQSSYDPMGFQNGDSVGVFFSHMHFDTDINFERIYAIYDIEKNRIQIRVDNDIKILPNHLTEFLEIENTITGFRIF